MSSSSPSLTAVVMADAPHASFEPLVDAGGPGSLPFALMPFANRPLLETLLETLRRNFCSLTYIVCSTRCADAVRRYIRSVSHKWRNMELKVISYGEAPSASATLRALLDKNQLPEKFVFVPIEAVFASLILPDMYQAHLKNEKECGAVMTVGMNNSSPGLLKMTYEHLQRKSAREYSNNSNNGNNNNVSFASMPVSPLMFPSSAAAAGAAAGATSGGSGGLASSGSNVVGGGGINNVDGGSNATSSPPTSPARKATTGDDAKQTFTIPLSGDGDGYDADLWSVVFDPHKGNCVKQFASWREIENSNLRQFDRSTNVGNSSRAQLLHSELSHYVLQCTMSGDIRILSDVEFTGICVCSSPLVTQVIQMHGNLLTMNDICRCLIENAELSDATFSAHVFSLPDPSSSMASTKGTAANFNSLTCQTARETGSDAAAGGGAGAAGSAYRSAFFELSMGGFQTPPLTATIAAAKAAAATSPLVLAGGSGAASAFTTATTADVPPSAASSAASGGGGGGGVVSSPGKNKPKKPALPGAPKILLPGAPIGAETSAPVKGTVSIAGVIPSSAQQQAQQHSKAVASSSSSSSLFFKSTRHSLQFVPIYPVRTFSSLIRAHVATASRQLLSLSMVMPSYVSYRGHPSVFVNIEGSGSMGIAVEANIGPNVIIGSGCFIPSTVVLQNCTLGDGVTLEDGVIIRDSVLHNNVSVSPGANIRHCVIGRSASIENNVKIKRCCVGANVKVKTSPPPRTRLVAPPHGTSSSGDAVDYFKTEIGAKRNFTALDHGIETDVTLLFAKIEDPNQADGSQFDDLSTDSRERFFRTLRPHVERAIGDNSPIEQLQPMMWRRMLIDLDGYTIEDLLECISRALVQIVGRKFSHKAGTLPTQTPTSRKSGGGRNLEHQREFDAADREHAVEYFSESVLSIWVPNLIMQLCRTGTSDFERDQMAVFDGLCRGVGSSEGEIFGDAAACQKILRRFMRFGVFSRAFLDRFKANMDEELEAQREARKESMMQDVQTPTEGGDAEERNSTSDRAGSFDTQQFHDGDTPTKRETSGTGRSAFDEEDNPLFIGWAFFEQAIDSETPMEHAASYVALNALGGFRARSLESLAESTPNSRVVQNGSFPNSTGVSPKQPVATTEGQKGNKKSGKAKKEEKKQKKNTASFLARDSDSSSSSDDDDDSSDDDDDDSSDDDDDENGESGGTNTTDTTSLQPTARLPAGSPWDSKQTTPPAATPVTAKEQLQKKLQQEEPAQKKAAWFLDKDSSSSSSSDDDDSDD